MARGAEEETVAWRYFCRDVVPFAAMVLVECVTVGSNTLFKAATLRGLSFYVFVFYTYVVGTLVLLPISLIFGRYLISPTNLDLYNLFKNMNLFALSRSRRLPPAKSLLFFKIFLLAFLG